MIQVKGIKYLEFIIFFISQLFYSQTVVSFYDVTKYQDENDEYIMYNNQKYTGKYLLNSDTVKILTSVKNGIIYNIEESGPNYKSIIVIKDDKKYKKVYNNRKSLILEGLLINDEKQGKWIDYYPNGQIKKVEFYDLDKKTGKWKYYNNEGEFLKMIIFKNELPFPELNEMNDKLVELSALDLRHENCKQNLENVSSDSHNGCDFVYYYTNSKYTGYAISKDETYFIDHGYAVFFKKVINNQVIEYSEINNKLERNGDYLKYGLLGEIKIRGHYRNNHKSGDWIEYYNSGRIESKKRYYYDKPTDWWFYYSETGDNVKIEIYSNGELESIGKPIYETRNSKYFDVNTIFYDAKVNKPLYQKKERHFIKNGYVFPLEYNEL